jgi:hypothetical protein
VRRCVAARTDRDPTTTETANTVFKLAIALRD